LLFNLKQKDGESLHDYTKQSKAAREVLRSHIGGPIVLRKWVLSMKDYDESNSDQMEKCCKPTSCFTFLENSGKEKYGSLLIGLQTQQSLKNNQYPKTVTEANNVLSNHRFDNAGIM
jgi:hypothetical protein